MAGDVTPQSDATISPDSAGVAASVHAYAPTSETPAPNQAITEQPTPKPLHEQLYGAEKAETQAWVSLMNQMEASVDTQGQFYSPYGNRNFQGEGIDTDNRVLILTEPSTDSQGFQHTIAVTKNGPVEILLPDISKKGVLDKIKRNADSEARSPRLIHDGGLSGSDIVVLEDSHGYYSGYKITPVADQATLDDAMTKSVEAAPTKHELAGRQSSIDMANAMTSKLAGLPPKQ